MAIIYTNQSSKKKPAPKSKKFLQAQQEHKKFLLSMGISTKPRKDTPRKLVQTEEAPQRKVAPTSDSIPSNGYKNTIDDYKWKRTSEKKSVIEETERKKSRVAPYTNKGAYMYITDAEDTKSIGRKL